MLIDNIKNIIRNNPVAYKIVVSLNHTFTQSKLTNEINTSLSSNQSLSEWWEQAHKTNHQYWLTGSSASQVWKSLNIENMIKPKTVVLNIGVGLGYDTKELYKRGCIVHALDISQTALDRVRKYTEIGLLLKDLPELPNDIYDLAISHLVAQHMTNEELGEQLRNVIRSLKPDGILAMQFSYPLDNIILASNESPTNTRAGGVLRTYAILEHMVVESGGKIIWNKKLYEYPIYNAGWYAVHIRKVCT